MHRSAPKSIRSIPHSTIDCVPARICNGMDAANQVLDNWAQRGVAAADYEITYEDGFTYSGYYRLDSRRPALLQHAVIRKESLAGTIWQWITRYASA